LMAMCDRVQLPTFVSRWWLQPTLAPQPNFCLITYTGHVEGWRHTP
jgi:hypothetical protein